APRLIGFATNGIAGGRRRNGVGEAAAEAARPSRCARRKTGKRAEAAKSCPNDHRSSGTALDFLSRHCHQRRPVERETEIRTFRGSEHRSFAFTQFRGRRGNRASAEFPGRLWPGNGWIRKTLRHFDGYSGIDEFFR